MARERVKAQPDEITRARMAIENGFLGLSTYSEARHITIAIDELIQLRIKEHADRTR